MTEGDAHDKAGASPATTGSGSQPGGSMDKTVSSGTASEALLKAASSVAEAETKPQPKAEPTATPKGDTSVKVEGKPPVETTAPATGEPKAGDPAAAAAATGDAPEARITAATRNARLSLLTNIGAHLELRDEGGQLRALTERDIPDLKVGMGLLRDIRTNPEEFFVALAERLGVNLPEPKEEDYTLPKPSLQSEDGKAAYSADDMNKALEILERKLTAKFEGQLKPLQETTGRMSEADETAQVQHNSRVKAGQVLTEMRTRPHFKDNEVKIAATLRQMDPRIKKELGPVGALMKAYTDVLASDVFPSLSSTAEQRVRDENARKAAGSAIVVPGAGGGDPKKVELHTPDQLALHMERLAAAQAF